jgi:hypothetical protein
MLVSRPIPNSSNAPAGSAGQLLRLVESGTAEAMPNDTDGKIMTMVSGSPAWATGAPTTPDLHSVAVFKASTSAAEAQANLSHYDLNNFLATDGVELSDGDTVLIRLGASRDGVEPVSNAHNGLYVVGSSSGGFAALTRHPHLDTAAKIGGVKIYVAKGTNFGGSTWKLPTMTTEIALDLSNLMFQRDDLGQTGQRLFTYKTVILDKSTSSSVGEVFGGVLFDFYNKLFAGTSIEPSIEADAYVTGAGLTGEIRVVDRDTHSVAATIAGITGTTPKTFTAAAWSLVDGHHYEIELAVAGGGGAGDKLIVNGLHIVFKNTKQ